MRVLTQISPAHIPLNGARRLHVRFRHIQCFLCAVWVFVRIHSLTCSCVHAALISQCFTQINHHRSLNIGSVWMPAARRNDYVLISVGFVCVRPAQNENTKWRHSSGTGQHYICHHHNLVHRMPSGAQAQHGRVVGYLSSTTQGRVVIKREKCPVHTYIYIFYACTCMVSSTFACITIYVAHTRNCDSVHGSSYSVAYAE